VVIVAALAATVVAAVHAATVVAAVLAATVVAAVLAADSAAAAATVVEAAATAVAVDTGKIRLIARNEKPALLRQAGFLHGCRDQGTEGTREQENGDTGARSDRYRLPWSILYASFPEMKRQSRYDVCQVRGTSCKAHVFICSCLCC
jgi:hypothetical protein